MKNFQDSMRNFYQSDKARIAIYKANESIRDGLYQDVSKELCKFAYVEIVDYIFLCSYQAMYRNVFDILVILESELLQEFEYRRIKDYLDKGGALILGGSNMLMLSEDTADNVTAYGAPLMGAEDPLGVYKVTVASLGVKPHVSDVQPQKARFDPDFVDGVDGNLVDMVLSKDSVLCNTTSDNRVPNPYLGTVFSERYEVLRNYEVVSGYDKFGRRLTTAVVFAQNYETGARICLFPWNGAGSFLDKANPYFMGILKAAQEFCRNKLVISFCETDYACYRVGEIPAVEYRIRSFDSVEKEVTVRVSILAEGKTIYKTICSHVVKAGKEEKGKVVWENAEFQNDIYEVQVRLYDEGRLISKADNGFVIWNEDVIEQGREIFCDGGYFVKDGVKSLFFGVNYYESNTNSAMWVLPNIAKLNADLKAMGDFGIEQMRIHYHHPKWFYDYAVNSHGEVPERYRHLGESYLPSEKYLRILDAHVYLCQKYRIVFMPDLLTLVPEELGDVRGWFGTVDYCVVEEKLEKQKEFLNLIIPRYKDVPGISWDIINEPGIGGFRCGVSKALKEEFRKACVNWANTIKQYMIELGERHPITVGDTIFTFDQKLDSYKDVVDYLAPHAYAISTPYIRDDSYKGPQMAHEIWLYEPMTPAGDQMQLSEMRKALINICRIGLAGFSPWQWTNQLAMWQNENLFLGEAFDDGLGCCVHSDGTIKPAGRFYQDAIRLLADIELDEYLGENRVKTADGVIDFGVPEEVKPGGHYMLYKRHDRTVRGIAKGSSMGEGYSIVTDNEDCNVFFDFSKDSVAYLKADRACRLIATFKKTVKKGVILGLNQEEKIGICDGRLELDLQDWQTYYWIKVDFEGRRKNEDEIK